MTSGAEYDSLCGCWSSAVQFYWTAAAAVAAQPELLPQILLLTPLPSKMHTLLVLTTTITPCMPSFQL